ncbi:MAG: tyrosine-type recombinase/integrase [Candidatus Heimdallarchaeota archaeon]|nr:tyrosine-type recombinase/integrase [Candidatus Heimdallarchaeota archaeon]
MTKTNLYKKKIKQVKRNDDGTFQRLCDFAELKKDPYIEQWLNNIKSKRQRLSLMQEFCNFVEKTPKELAREHQDDLQLDPLKRTRIAKKQLNAFFGYLTGTKDKKWKSTLNNKEREKTISWNSARQYVFSKLMSFYSRLGIPVKYAKKDKPKEKDKNVREKTWRHDGEIIKKENMKSFLKKIKDSFSNILDRSIFYSKLSSGLDDVDLFELKIKDFKRGYLQNYGICYLQGNRKKDGILYQTFLGTEACESIILYLRDRQRKGEMIFDESGNYLDKALNYWLFVGKKRTNGSYSKMKPRYFTETMKETIEKLNLENITPKSLRRWFNSWLTRNSINKGVIKRFMGQKVDVQDKHYNLMLEQAKEGEFQDLTKFYYEKIDELISLGNGVQKLTQVDKKIERMEKLLGKVTSENEKLKEQLAKTNKKLQSYDKNLEEIEKIKTQIDRISGIIKELKI